MMQRDLRLVPRVGRLRHDCVFSHRGGLDAERDCRLLYRRAKSCERSFTSRVSRFQARAMMFSRTFQTQILLK